MRSEKRSYADVPNVEGVVGASQVPSVKSIRTQLNRILDSPTFAKSPRLSRFLLFIVEQTLLGYSAQIKEYQLGLEVFDRGEGFDPRLDPIVRVAARRLRSYLERYYEVEGQHDPVRIALHKGTYVPVFRLTGTGASRNSTRALLQPVRPDKKARISLVVLPFSDHSPKRDQGYFCDGLTEELIRALTRASPLRVIAWPSAFRLKGDPRDVREIGAELRVKMALQGSIRKHLDRIRVTVKLIEFLESRYVWSETYDCSLKDVFAVQERIAKAIVEALEIQIAAEQPPQLIRRGTENLQAYKLYLKGRYYWNSRTEEGLKKAIETFQQAVAEDSYYALAYAGLADAYSLLGFYGTAPPTEFQKTATDAALRAVEIDPTLNEAHTSLAYVRAVYEYDWGASEREFETALALGPDFATTHHWYAIGLLAPLGRLQEAAYEIRRACELDPISLAVNRDAAVILYYQRQYDAVIEQCQRTLTLEPVFHGGYWALGLAYEQKSMFPEAVSAFMRGLQAPQGDVSDPQLLGSLAHTYALWGRRSEALGILSRLCTLAEHRYICPFEFALAHMGLGQLDQAFDWLQKLYDVRSYELTRLRVDPRYDSLRSDARFGSFLARLGLS